MQPFYIILLIGGAMLFSIYQFYLTRLRAVEKRNKDLGREVEELHAQLDAAIRKEQKAVEEGEYARVQKRQILATVNHEIRTPMNGMLGMAYLLVDSPLDKMQREYVDTIKYCGENLLRTVNEILVRDLLNFSKSEREGVALEKKDFELRTCIRECLLLFGERIPESGPELSYTMEEGVPEQINGDRKRLSQVLINLLENAVRHTRKGEIHVRMKKLPPDPGQPDLRQGLVFEVEDSGIGINPSRLKTLFDGVSCIGLGPRAEQAPDGLGLMVCRKLVQLMGGEIEVESRPGEGTLFRFNILFNPAVKGKVSPLQPGMVQPGKKIRVAGGCRNEKTKRVLSVEFAREFPLNILVAEDNPINQKLAIAVLQRLGYEPQLAENGKEVLEMADNREPYDLILMDVQMPEMDGLEATRMLRLCLAKQPVIIAMTANAMEGDQDECLQAGMDDYISKPVDIDDLMGRLEKWGRSVKAKKMAS